MRLTGLFWWIDRWRKSTAYTDMTLEQQGAYRNLLDEATLRGGPIPNNERILAKACGDALAWKRVRAVVLARFVLTPDGWRNVTLDAVLRESNRRAEKQRRWRERRANPDLSPDFRGNASGNAAGNKPGSPDPDPDPDSTNTQDALRASHVFVVEDWFAECKEIHGGQCEFDQWRHYLRKQAETLKKSG